MRRSALLLLLGMAGIVPAQDDAGRDTGEGPNAVLFVTWRRTAEAGEISGAAWQALEPHYGILSRRRLASFDASDEAGRVFFTEHAEACAVVAFDGRSGALAAATDPGRPILRVGPTDTAHIDTRVSRSRLAELIRLLRPDAHTVARFGPASEGLPGLEVRQCERAEEVAGCDVAWIAEGATIDAGSLQSALDGRHVPLVSTHESVPVQRAALTVRPDPGGLGLRLAAMLLRWARHGEAFGHETVARLRVTVDLNAADRAGFDVPLPLLARADEVRRRR